MGSKEGLPRFVGEDRRLTPLMGSDFTPVCKGCRNCSCTDAPAPHEGETTAGAAVARNDHRTAVTAQPALRPGARPGGPPSGPPPAAADVPLRHCSEGRTRQVARRRGGSRDRPASSLLSTHADMESNETLHVLG